MKEGDLFEIRGLNHFSISKHALFKNLSFNLDYQYIKIIDKKRYGKKKYFKIKFFLRDDDYHIWWSLDNTNKNFEKEMPEEYYKWVGEKILANAQNNSIIKPTTYKDIAKRFLSK